MDVLDSRFWNVSAWFVRVMELGQLQAARIQTPAFHQGGSEHWRVSVHGRDPKQKPTTETRMASGAFLGFCPYDIARAK